MKNYMRAMTLIMMTTLIASCGIKVETPLSNSNSTSELKKETAFDIAGSYTLTTEPASEEMLMEIKNEGSLSNVYAEITRDDFTVQEKTLFRNYSIPLGKVEKFKRNFVVGVGKHNAFWGGENILQEDGNTGKFYVHTSTPEALVIDTFTFHYEIHAKIERNSQSFKGKMKLVITDSRNAPGTIILDPDSLVISFQAK